MKIRESAEKAVVVSPPHRAEAGDISFDGDPGWTKQQFQKDCDVNEILKRCIRYGAPLPGSELQATFADVSQVGDFSEAMRRVRAAEDAFALLPAEVRLEFGND